MREVVFYAIAMGILAASGGPPPQPAVMERAPIAQVSAGAITKF
jgi:hypothetical protein